MRFNTKELAYYASTRFGKADKEGALWMKEYEGLIKKKESELTIDIPRTLKFVLSLKPWLFSLHSEMVPADWKPAVLL